MKWNLNDQNIYAGVAGVDDLITEFDFGYGIKLEKTYAHIFAPIMAAFKKAERGKPHPTPWKAVSGGDAYDIFYELSIPKETNLFSGIDRLNTVWLIAALMRLKIVPFFTIPVISNVKFSEIPTSTIEPEFHTIEIRKRNLFNNIDGTYAVDFANLEWIREHLIIAGKLFESEKKYQIALLALDQAIHDNRFSLSLITMWGALEQVFSPDDKQELGYRTSLNIASYLTERGKDRVDLFKRIRKLYTARSKAAHGNADEDEKDFVETYGILKGVLIKMTIENHVPQRTDLDNLILT